MKIWTVINQLERSEGYGQGMVSICYKYLLITPCSICSLCFPPLFWKYVTHSEGESIGVGAEMNDNEQMHWKIVDKCTHLAFYCLSSWKIKTEPSISHRPCTGPLQSPGRYSVWLTAFSFSLLAFFFHCWRPYLPDAWAPNALILLSGCHKVFSVDLIIPSVLKLCYFMPSSFLCNPLLYHCLQLRNKQKKTWVILNCKEATTLTLNICKLTLSSSPLRLYESRVISQGRRELGKRSCFSTSQNIPWSHNSYAQIWFYLVPYPDLWKCPRLDFQGVKYRFWCSPF